MDTKSDFDEEILKLVLNRMAIKYGVTLLFHTTVTETVVVIPTTIVDRDNVADFINPDSPY